MTNTYWYQTQVHSQVPNWWFLKSMGNGGWLFSWKAWVGSNSNGRGVLSQRHNLLLSPKGPTKLFKRCAIMVQLSFQLKGMQWKKIENRHLAFGYSWFFEREIEREKSILMWWNNLLISPWLFSSIQSLHYLGFDVKPKSCF